LLELLFAGRAKRVAAAFFVGLAFEAAFFLVTFLRESFRLAFDLLPALAAFFFAGFFFATFFLAAFFLVFFLLGAFFFDASFFFEATFFLVTFFLLVFFLPTFFLLGFFDARTAPRLRDAVFAAFLETFFFLAAFFAGMRGIPRWLQTQPAIIQRWFADGSLLRPDCADLRFRAARQGAERPSFRPGVRR